MESDRDREPVGQTPEAELDAVRRAVARPHLEYPSPGPWVWPVSGLAAALYTWSWALDQPFPGLLVMFGAIGICVGVVIVITRARGIFPDFSTMPPRLKREVIVAWIQTAVLVPIVFVIALLAGVAVAAIVAGLAFATIMYLHQRRHDAIVETITGAGPAGVA